MAVPPCKVLSSSAVLDWMFFKTIGLDGVVGVALLLENWLSLMVPIFWATSVAFDFNILISSASLDWKLVPAGLLLLLIVPLLNSSASFFMLVPPLFNDDDSASNSAAVAAENFETDEFGAPLLSELEMITPSSHALARFFVLLCKAASSASFLDWISSKFTADPAGRATPVSSSWVSSAATIADFLASSTPFNSSAVAAWRPANISFPA